MERDADDGVLGAFTVPGASSVQVKGSTGVLGRMLGICGISAARCVLCMGWQRWGESPGFLVPGPSCVYGVGDGANLPNFWCRGRHVQMAAAMGRIFSIRAGGSGMARGRPPLFTRRRISFISSDTSAHEG
jgi:hypothetical protein